MWAITPFISHPAIDEVVVVLPADDLDTPPEWLRDLPVDLIGGGTERADSVFAGLGALSLPERVLVHDGARPLVSRELIGRVLAGDPSGGVVPGVRVTDTLKEVGSEGLVVATPPRERYWRAQTPQAFPLVTLLQLHDRARSEGFAMTDDAALFEHYGYDVRMVEGDDANIKVTTSVDLALADLLLKARQPAG